MSAEYGSSNPLLDARLEGSNLFNAPANQASKHYYNFSVESGVPDVKFNGVSIYAYDANKGDKMNLWTEYTIDGGTTWLRYKKFGKSWNIAPNTLMKDILFPTTPTNGVRVVFEYINNGNNAVDFFANLYNFIDQQVVNPAQGQQGVDWW